MFVIPATRERVSSGNPGRRNAAGRTAFPPRVRSLIDSSMSFLSTIHLKSLFPPHLPIMNIKEDVRRTLAPQTPNAVKHPAVVWSLKRRFASEMKNMDETPGMRFIKGAMTRKRRMHIAVFSSAQFWKKAVIEF